MAQLLIVVLIAKAINSIANLNKKQQTETEK